MSRIKLIACFILIVTCFVTPPASASEKKIKLIVSDNPQSQYVAEQLESKLLNSEQLISIDKSILDNKFSDKAFLASDLIISIGTKSTNFLLNNSSKSPIYSLMVPKTIYNNLLTSANINSRYSSLYLDQPFERYLSLIKDLLPNSKRIGIFSNTRISSEQGLYEQSAKDLGFELIVKSINKTNSPINEINALFSDVDVVILLPEKIINQLSAKWILYSAFRNKKPVIGFSKKFLEAGALASIHSDLDLISNEAFKDIIYFINNNKFLEGPHYPENFEIDVNESVSRSLNIPFKNF